MTLSPARVKFVTVEKTTDWSLTFSYALPVLLLLVTIVASVVLSARASYLEREILNMRSQMTDIRQHEELLNQQISKLTIGKDVVNW